MSRLVHMDFEIQVAVHFMKSVLNQLTSILKSLNFCRKEIETVKMAYVASSEYSRVTSESTERRGPRFGMEKGTRIDPGQVYFNGKYVNEKEIFKVRQTHKIKFIVIENRII